MWTTEIIEYARARSIDVAHVKYMLNPSFFNMRPARDYVEACRALENVQIVQNDFSMKTMLC